MIQDFSLGPAIVADVLPYFLLRHVLELKPAGTAVEFGVGSGFSTSLMAAQMPVVGFDSGEGLPEDWRPEFPKGSFRYEIPTVDNAGIVVGWFAETLPRFDFAALGHIGLVHFDADLYSSTATALEYVGPHLRPDTYCVFDEWFGYDGAENHEQLAWAEFAAETGICWATVGHCDQAWAIRITERQESPRG